MPAQTPSARDLGLNFGRGLLMGAADVVPGVSGGTVALIVGIYERLIRSIRCAAAVPILLLRGQPGAARERWRGVEWSLVLPLGLGIGMALFGGALVILPLRESYPEATRAVFFGMIAASVPLPWRRIGQHGGRTAAALVAAAVLAFLLVGLPEREFADPALTLVFVCAAVAICAMILPGVSGAFLLLVFGIYDPTLAALRDLNLVYIAAFGAGAALGLGLFAKLLETLLVRYHDVTMAALVGLMLGALRALWPWLDHDRSLLAPPAEVSTAVVALLGVVAFGVVTMLVALARRRGTTAQRLST
jgi:putative membrane protein